MEYGYCWSSGWECTLETTLAFNSSVVLSGTLMVRWIIVFGSSGSSHRINPPFALITCNSPPKILVSFFTISDHLTSKRGYFLLSFVNSNHFLHNYILIIDHIFLNGVNWVVYRKKGPILPGQATARLSSPKSVPAGLDCLSSLERLYEMYRWKPVKIHYFPYSNCADI